MIRYDQASRVVKHFVGSTEVTDTVISPNAFVTGKYFMTLAAPATDLVDLRPKRLGHLSGSDGNTYRKLDAASIRIRP